MLTVNLQPFQTLETERLLLRQVVATDVNEVFFLRSNSEVLKYINKEPCKSHQEALEHIQLLTKLFTDNEGIAWAITQKGDNIFLGSIGVWNIIKQHYRAEFGYSLHPNFHKKGIMSEAAKAVINYAFVQMRLHSLEANVNPENTASIKILERNGFVREGYFKESYFFDNRFQDSALYSLISPYHFIG